MARRLVPTLVLLLLLAACPGDAPEETEIRESDPGVFAGALTVRAAGPFLGGEEPVLDVRAGSRGTLALSVFRARQPDSAAASLFGSGGDAEQLDENTDFARVRTWNHAVSAGKSTLSLGPLEPGLYVLEAGASGKSLHVPVVVSNLSVVVKRGAGEALVWVVRAGNGRPVPDAAVTLHAEDGPRRLELDSDGVARVDVEDSERLRLFARDGDDIAIADATWLPSAPRDRLVYVTTDRPLYRPGETVGVKGIARRVVGERMKPFGTVEAIELISPRDETLASDEPAPALNDQGTFSHEFALAKDAPLGGWRVVVTIDGRRYGGEFRVEAVRRPEAEVLVTAKPRLVIQGDEAALTVAARDFAGGAVGGARVEWSIHRSPRVRPAWRSPDAEEFLGASERRAAKPVEVARGEGKLDEKGALVVEVPTEKRDDEYALVLRARVRDEAGLTVSGSGSVLAVRSLVTVDLRTDREVYEIGETIVGTVRVRGRGGVEGAIPVRISATDENGATVWESRDPPDEHGRFEIPAARAGSLRIEVAALDPREREARVGRTVWITERGRAPGYGGDGITLVADRETYAPGDEARILVLVPAALDHAKVLLTVESDRLHDHRVEEINGTSESVPMSVRARYGAAFRVRATAVRNGRALRGEVRLLAPPLDRKLSVTVTPGAEDYRPGGRGFVTVRVTDRAGNPAPCEVAVAGVDEALLALAPDLAPSILSFFHGPRGDRVRTFTSAEVGFHGTVRTSPPTGNRGLGAEEEPPIEMEEEPIEDPSILDEPPVEEIAPLETEKFVSRGARRTAAVRANFSSRALWEPHVLVSDTGEAVVPVTFPDDLTRWRFQAVAVDRSGRVGTGEGRAVVTQPLRLTLAMPRFLTERDEIAVPVVITAPAHVGENARVVVEPEAGLGHAKPATFDLTLDAYARAHGTLRLTGLVRGEFALTARAAMGEERDAVTRRIPVRSHGLHRASALAACLDDARPWTGDILVPRDARPGSVRLTLRFEPTRLEAIWQALDMLIEYPHGCVEQTLNRFLPDLQAYGAVSLLGLGDHPRAGELPAFVAAGAKRLVELQNEDGSWGWWGNKAGDPAMTALVVGGLTHLAEVGLPHPEAETKRGVAALAKLSATPGLDYETRALILATIPNALPAGYAERLFDDEVRSRASPQTLALLLRHFRREKREAEVAVLTREVLTRMHRSDDGTSWGKTEARRWQDDAVETTARVIEVLAPDPEQRAIVEEATRWLLATRNGNAWQSTRDTAAAVRALLTLALETPGPKGKSAVRIRVDDGIVGQVSLAANGWKGETVSLELPPPLFAPGAERSLTLERVGGLTVDVNAILEYESTAENLPAVATGFTVSRTIHRLEPVREGERIVHARRDPAGVRVGDLLMLETTVRPDRAGEFLECEVPYPAGTEPVRDTTAIAIEGGDVPDPAGAHVERRDDAAWFFLRRAGTGEIRFRVILRVTHAGRFHVLPARAGLMYFPHETGSSAKARLVVAEDER